MLYLVSKENPFKQEVREYPVDFGYPKQEKYNININIPEGFVVESMPESYEYCNRRKCRVLTNP